MDSNRLYSETRVSHMWTWAQIRAFHVNMATVLPQPFHYTGLDVQVGSTRYETWSPNSARIAPYPGIHPIGSILRDYFGHRLLDGSSGRFDPGFYPQVLTDDIIHFAFFMVRPPVPENQLLENFPEFSRLTSYWVPDIYRRGYGEVKHEFHAALERRCAKIEALRVDQYRTSRSAGLKFHRSYCSRPTESDVSRILGVMRWEDAVDTVALLQFHIKEKVGYYYYYRTMSSVNAMDAMDDGIKQANMQKHRGGWINELSQANVNLLLRARIPVFVIHEYIRSVDYGTAVAERRQQRDTHSFYADLDLSYLEPFEKLMDSNAVVRDMPHSLVSLGPDPRSRSGSWTQGHIRVRNEVFSRPDSPDASERGGWNDSDYESDPHDDEPHFVLRRQDIPSGFEDDNAPSTNSAVTPPPIFKADSNSAGRWSRWTDAPWDVEVTSKIGEMRKISKATAYVLQQGSAQYLWYDREHKRMLWLQDNPSRIDFGNTEWGQSFPPTLRFPAGFETSKWIYLTLEPKSGWANLTYGEEVPRTGLTTASRSTPRISPYERRRRAANEYRRPGFAQVGEVRHSHGWQTAATGTVHVDGMNHRQSFRAPPLQLEHHTASDSSMRAGSGWGAQSENLTGWGAQDRDSTGWGGSAGDLSGWGTSGGDMSGWGAQDHDSTGWGAADGDTSGWGCSDNFGGWGASDPSSEVPDQTALPQSEVTSAWGISVENSETTIADAMIVDALPTAAAAESNMMQVDAVSSIQSSSGKGKDKDMSGLNDISTISDIVESNPQGPALAEHLTTSERAGFAIPPELAPFDRMIVDPIAGASSSVSVCTVPHQSHAPQNEQNVSAALTGNPNTVAQQPRRVYTEDCLPEETRASLSKGRIRKLLKRMTREQRGIEMNSEEVHSDARKFAKQGIFVPSRHGKKRNPSVHVLNVHLRVNVQPGVEPDVQVNVDDPSAIKVTIVGAKKQSSVDAESSLHRQA